MPSLPYNPTRILPSPNDENIFYIFQSLNATSSDVQLLALNASASDTFDGTSLPTSILSDSLPFLTADENSAYTPALDELENLLLYVGNCRNSRDGSMLWEFRPDNATSYLDGSWTSLDLSMGPRSGNHGLIGANYLASGIAFSNTADSSSRMYVFGGMCPTITAGSSSNDWINDSDYSNSMLTIEPPVSTAEGDYQLGVSSSRGPPVAEAGFTITPLEPTFSQPSIDNATRNQNYILLGGHTQNAFINMTQVALFSLPEETWAFLPVNAPGKPPKTDLAARVATTVDPRSGHTAVLTQDGKQVVIFGGWVGDIATAAEPQLAVLELGDGYGGSGDWQWTIPSQSGTGPEDGGGLYGHGAAMLPGGVMMITGGYTTSGPSSLMDKRADPSVNTNNYFFNTTSNTWISSYTHPKPTPKDQYSAIADADRSATSKRVGLGAGLTCGILALMAVIIVYFWYSQRLKRRRDAREAELRHLGLDAHRSSSMLRPEGMSQPESEMTARDAYMMARASGERTGPRRKDMEAERTGLLFEIPSPTRGLRRSLHSRGTYQPAPRYDDGRLARGSGNIHPIDEREEYDQDMINEGLRRHSKGPTQDPHTIKSAPALDPFRDQDGSRPPSPQSPARERELEQRNWVSDWAAADALMHHRGRQSPDKSDRTSSTLSDQSARSMVSAQSWQHSLGTISRSMSQRSAALFFSRPFSPPIEDNAALPRIDVRRAQSMTAATSSNTRRSQSLTLFSNPRRPNNPDTTPITAPSFQQLQFESEALLGGYNDRSPTRSQSRARGWMGSVRRVLTGTDRSASASPEHGELSASTSPTRWHHHGDEAGLPRRAASTGAMLWQKRQGARDWDVEGGPSRTERADGEYIKEAEEEEWDVETAVERRVVQVMFTVPKEKLRVVNRGPDGDGVSVVSRESSVKDTGKGNMVQGKGKEKEDDS